MCALVFPQCVSLLMHTLVTTSPLRDNGQTVVVGGQLLFALGCVAQSSACVWLSPGSRREAPVLEHGCPRLQHPYQSDESMGAPDLPH